MQVSDENTPPSSIIPNPPGSQAVLSQSAPSASGRPQRSTRTCFRDLTNTNKNVGTLIKRKISSATTTPPVPLLGGGESEPKQKKTKKEGSSRKSRSGKKNARTKKARASVLIPILPAPLPEQIHETSSSLQVEEEFEEIEPPPPLLVSEEEDVNALKSMPALSLEDELGLKLSEDEDEEDDQYPSQIEVVQKGGGPPTLTAEGGVFEDEPPPPLLHPCMDSVLPSLPVQSATPPLFSSSSSKKRKKPKGRNGNIYIGVNNRVLWMELQEKFGFDNINSFGHFVMVYMNKVYDDFSILHQVALDLGIYEPHGLSSFKWVNGLPHPVNEAGEFITLPEIEMSEEYTKRVFEKTFELCVKRGKFLIDLAMNSVNAEEQDDEDGVDQDTQMQENLVASEEADEALPQDLRISKNENEEPNPNEDLNPDEEKQESMEIRRNDGQNAPKIIENNPAEPITFFLPVPPSTTSTGTPAPQGTGGSENQENPETLMQNCQNPVQTETPTSTSTSITPQKWVEALANLDEKKKEALKKILGDDLSLESINSPENFSTPINTPTCSISS